jgi:hypothetical protein
MGIEIRCLHKIQFEKNLLDKVPPRDYNHGECRDCDDKREEIASGYLLYERVEVPIYEEKHGDVGD